MITKQERKSFIQQRHSLCCLLMMMMIIINHHSSIINHEASIMHPSIVIVQFVLKNLLKNDIFAVKKNWIIIDYHNLNYLKHHLNINHHHHHMIRSTPDWIYGFYRAVMYILIHFHFSSYINEILNFSMVYKSWNLVHEKLVQNLIKVLISIWKAENTQK